MYVQPECDINSRMVIILESNRSEFIEVSEPEMNSVKLSGWEAEGCAGLGGSKDFVWVCFPVCEYVEPLLKTTTTHNKVCTLDFIFTFLLLNWVRDPFPQHTTNNIYGKQAAK